METVTAEVREVVRLDPVDAVTIGRNAEAALAVARGVVIDSDVMYEVTAEELMSVKQTITRLDEHRKAITKPLDEAKARVMDLFRKPVETLKSAEAIMKLAMSTYVQAKEAEAERQRQAAEKAAREVQARIDAEAKAAQEQAAALAAAGDAEAAQEAAEHAEELKVAAMMPVAPIAVAVAAPKVAGVSTRKVFGAEIVDEDALYKHVATNAALRRQLFPLAQGELDKMAKAMKEAFEMPGCRLTVTTSVAGRRT